MGIIALNQVRAPHQPSLTTQSWPQVGSCEFVLVFMGEASIQSSSATDFAAKQEQLSQYKIELPPAREDDSDEEDAGGKEHRGKVPTRGEGKSQGRGKSVLDTFGKQWALEILCVKCRVRLWSF